MAAGTDQVVKFLREILRELQGESLGSPYATSGKQDQQIALETAIKAVLDTVSTNTSTADTLLTAISNALTTLNTNVATAANQTSQINQVNPTNKYKISELDTTGPSYNYYGYVDKDGNWYISRQALTSSVLNTFTFVTGSSSFSTAWTNRATQTYVTFDNAF